MAELRWTEDEDHEAHILEGGWKAIIQGAGHDGTGRGVQPPHDSPAGSSRPVRPRAPTAENACARWSGGQPPKQREAVPVVGCRDVTGWRLHWRGVGRPWSV
jgi:hypothetical protein